MSVQPAVGQVWADNYNYRNGYVRHVRVLAIDGERATIQGCNKDGTDAKGRNPKTKTKLSRFGQGGTTGYTFVSGTPITSKDEPA